MIKITTLDDKPIESGIRHILRQIESKLDNSGQIIAETLSYETKSHIGNRYPGSKHYNPEKVSINDVSHNSGQINVDIPGISRAYHDIDIKPKFRSYLAIPMFKKAMGLKPKDFDNTFILTKKNNKKFIVQKNGNNLAWLFFLSKHVHQMQDSTLMPNNDFMVKKIMTNLDF